MPHKQHLIGHFADFAMVVAFGAFVHASLQHKQARALRVTFTILDWFISFTIAGFTGTMAILGGTASGVTSEPALIWLGGAGAVLGLKSFNVMFDIAAEYVVKTRGKR